MEKAIKNFKKKGYIVFSVEIGQEEKNGKWKKKPKMPKGWQESTKEIAHVDPKKNGIALLTGEVNNIIVIDIDNVKEWEKLLEEENVEEPKTVKVISGSGGIHYYFKYDEELANVTSKDHAIKNYAIDVKTNGGCIYVPPTKYYNKNANKEVEYKWETSIFDMEPIVMPKWLKELLLEKHKEKKIKNKAEQKVEEVEENEDINDMIEFEYNEICAIVNMLSKSRAEGYESWLNVGMCLHNINKNYLYVWDGFSKKSGKYEKGVCEEKWKTFKKNKNGLKIGSLLKWCKEDNEKGYKEIMEKKRLNSMVMTKYPNDKLVLGQIREVSEICKYIDINNECCLFKGSKHDDLNPSMYIEITSGYMTAKCKHPECYGKTYCGHKQLSKQETNYIFNNVVNIINVGGKDDELVEFQKVDLFEDVELNELVYNGLNGKSSELAEILFYYYKDKYNYGENNEWYVYEDHKWKNIGNKNTKIRSQMQKKLKEIYGNVLEYHKENDNEKNKIKSLKQLLNNFGETTLKNNVMTELIDLFLENKNSKRDFVSKLDSNQNLIGFNNGVYDLRTFEFREGKADDYITMSVNYDYTDKYSKNYDKLLNFLSDIQPNKVELDYLLTYLSTGLYGNTLELFTVLTGTGRNGKSKIIELLDKTFGDYFGSIKSQLLTSQIKDGDAPAPGILDLLHKKIVVASETLEGTKLNTGFIKFLTGRDTATFRLCHQNDMIKFRANFITLLACNNIPECDNMDNAFSKRLRCLNFPTEFVDDPKDKHHKKKDDNINIYFDEWKQDFMLLLLQYYKKYIENDKKLVATENVLKWTDQYKDEADLYLSFLNECTEEAETHIKTTILYENFKEWFKINNPHQKIPSNREFIKNIKKHRTIEHVKIDGKSVDGIKNCSIK
jgi:P4 family phage/plasmid primase-like protien